MKGPMAGASHNVFYGAYVFFEKVRIAEGKPKTKHRLDMEAAWGAYGGISRESDRGGYVPISLSLFCDGWALLACVDPILTVSLRYFCFVGERPVMDSLGRVDYIRD